MPVCLSVCVRECMSVCVCVCVCVCVLNKLNLAMICINVKVEKLDLPMKRNQAFIVTHFSKTREKFCDHLLGDGEKKRDERKELLIKVLQFNTWRNLDTFLILFSRLNWEILISAY